MIESSATYSEQSTGCTTKFEICVSENAIKYGAKTILTIKDVNQTDMDIQFQDVSGRRSLNIESKEINLIFKGDAEFRNFCKGIEFINNQLKTITGGN